MKDNILENEINITEIIKEVEIQKKENIIIKLIIIWILIILNMRKDWRKN